MPAPKISLVIWLGEGERKGIPLDEALNGNRVTKPLDIPYPLPLGTRYEEEGSDRFYSMSGNVTEYTYYAVDNEIAITIVLDITVVEQWLVEYFKDSSNGWKVEQ